MIMKNGQTVDPLNPFSKALKMITKKRTKTDSDYEEMARIEYKSALYMGVNGPVIPQSNIEAMLIAAAKKFKEGIQAKSGMYVKGNADLIYDGPKDPEAMFANSNFRDVRAVTVGRAKVMRSRPIFHEWEANVTVVYEDEVVNVGRVDEWVKTAGTSIGLCEMRPRFGRFEVI